MRLNIIQFRGLGQPLRVVVMQMARKDVGVKNRATIIKRICNEAT
jgi:hypothetical protein